MAWSYYRVKIQRKRKYTVKAPRNTILAHILPPTSSPSTHDNQNTPSLKTLSAHLPPRRRVRAIEAIPRDPPPAKLILSLLPINNPLQHEQLLIPFFAGSPPFHIRRALTLRPCKGPLSILAIRWPGNTHTQN